MHLIRRRDIRKIRRLDIRRMCRLDIHRMGVFPGDPRRRCRLDIRSIPRRDIRIRRTLLGLSLIHSIPRQTGLIPRLRIPGINRDIRRDINRDIRPLPLGIRRLPPLCRRRHRRPPSLRSLC